MALVVEEKDFQHILRILNTNVDGRRKVPFALTAIKGVGRRFAHLVCKRASIDTSKRAGELKKAEVANIVTILSEASQYVPVYFLNRQSDRRTGKQLQLVSNELNANNRADYARWKKIRLHRGLRHMWGIKTRGQRTKTTGRRGRIPGTIAPPRK